ncbi:MAG: NAD-dependent protein deacylase [Planctomycetota bacterium]
MSIYGVRDALLESKRAIAFTGAGVSVASGIPDFRSREGIWARYPPEEFGTIEAFVADPVRWWEFFRALATSFAAVAPNPAHQALAELERLGCLQTVVTQNIDRLHQRAGSAHVIELHGSSERLKCLTCEKVIPTPAPQEGPLPRCQTCAEVLKPDVVLFGELLPLAPLEEAQALARGSDLCLVVGTSAVVYPAASIPELVQRHGGTVCQINRETTDLTHLGYVRWFVQGDAEEVLPRLVELVRAARTSTPG